jgi:hypothetical protein
MRDSLDIEHLVSMRQSVWTHLPLIDCDCWLICSPAVT